MPVRVPALARRGCDVESLEIFEPSPNSGAGHVPSCDFSEREEGNRG